MGLGSEVNDISRRVFFVYLCKSFLVADIRMFEEIIRRGLHFISDILDLSGIGECINVYEGDFWMEQDIFV